MRWVQLLSSHDDESFSTAPTMGARRDSVTSLESASTPPMAQRLLAYATRWPLRIGALELRSKSPRSYEAYTEMTPREDDAEQIAADVDRSSVDGLEELAVPWFDPAEHCAALSRLLRAFCVRSPGGYCQGMNFSAAVFLMVMQHGVDEHSRRPSGSSSSAAPHADRGVWGKDPELALCGAEEMAFWTFVALLERLLPADFFLLPSMAGLQCDVRVLQQLARTEIRVLQLAGVNEDDLAAVLKLTAYKWLIPCFVNQLPIATLLAYWEKLLLRAPPQVQGEPLLGVSSAHLQLSLALLHECAEELLSILITHPNEAMGLAFNMLLDHALARHDAARLLQLASRFELNHHQLSYLRSHLRHGTQSGHADASLSGVQSAIVSLLSEHRQSLRVVQLARESILIAPLPPPPFKVACSVPQHYGQFVSMCTLTFVAFCLWTSRALVSAIPRRPRTRIALPE